MMKIKKFIACFSAAVFATSMVSIISVPADDNDQPLSSGTITLEDEGNWWTELFIDGSTWLGELDLYDIDPSTGYIEFYIDTDNNTGVGYDSYEVQSTDEETGEDSYFKMVSFEDGGLVVNISDVNTDNYYFIVWTSSADVTTYSINWTLYGEYRSNESELAELQALIAQAYEIDADNYTEDKYAALLEAIAAAEEIDDTDYCSVTKAAKEALQAAIDGLDGKLSSGTITLEDEGNWWTELYIDESTWFGELSLYDIDPMTGYIEFWIDTDNNTGIGYNDYEVQSTDEETGEDSYFKMVSFEDGYLVVSTGCIDTENYYFIVWASSDDVAEYNIYWQICGEYRSNENELAELQALIAQAYELEADDYTEDTHAALLEAIAAAEEIDDTDYCTVTEAAKEALQAAIDGLVKFTIGDANLDGNIDYLDAMTVLRADAELIELTDEQLIAADVNGDGSVDSLDAILILRYDAGLIENFE